jgi:H+/Cl- antiporter ClcA
LKGFDRFGSGEQGVIFLWPNSFSQGAWNLAWALLLGAGGGCLGLLFLLLRRQLVKQIKRCQASPLPLAIFTGVVLALVNIWQPLALFSGEQQLSPLLQGELVNRADQLLLVGFLKIALCALCLSTGWMGGIFFPLIIGAAAIGQGLHQAAGIIPGEVAISDLVAGIQAMVLAQPWVPFVITVVVLKGHALPAAAIGSLMGWRLSRYVRNI